MFTPTEKRTCVSHTWKQDGLDISINCDMLKHHKARRWTIRSDSSRYFRAVL